MCDDAANNYREKAQILIEAAGRALDHRVQGTLRGLATSALRIAAELETKQHPETPIAETSSQRKG